MGKPRLYPTTPDGQPLLTNWTRNHQLDEYARPTQPPKEATPCPT